MCAVTLYPFESTIITLPSLRDTTMTPLLILSYLIAFGTLIIFSIWSDVKNVAPLNSTVASSTLDVCKNPYKVSMRLKSI